MTAAKKKASLNPVRTGEFAEPHVDLRDWLERAESLGELKRVSGVDWKDEFTPVAESSPELKKETLKKWGSLAGRVITLC